MLTKKNCPFRVVSFFTPEYEDHADRLIESLRKFQLPYAIHVQPGFGNWESNCNFKAEFLYTQWKKSSKPIVWLDADATVEQKPELFYELARIGGFDIAVRRNEKPDHPFNRVMSGTIWLGKTDNAYWLLKRWNALCAMHNRNWDQVNLADAIDAGNKIGEKYKVAELPEEYCAVFDLRVNHSKPVILHHQASRQLKNQIRG